MNDELSCFVRNGYSLDSQVLRLTNIIAT